MFDVPGFAYGPRAIIANGPTVVLRQSRQFLPDGPCIIETRILELSLEGIFNPDCRDPNHVFPVSIRLDPQTPTLGSIVSSDDGMGNPDFPNESTFDVNVEIDIEGLGVFPHAVEGLGNLLSDGDLWDFHPCVHPSDPYRPLSLDHAHIPCPADTPPTGCCLLGPNEFHTNQVICESLGGTYLGNDVECPSGCEPIQTGVVEDVLEAVGIGHITPNPSAGSVRMTYHLDAEARVRIDLYDASGRLMRRYPIKQRGIGEHEFVWDGRDEEGRDLPAGVYFLTLEAGNARTTRGIVLQR
jgi:hypothetical protein